MSPGSQVPNGMDMFTMKVLTLQNSKSFLEGKSQNTSSNKKCSKRKSNFNLNKFDSTKENN